MLYRRFKVGEAIIRDPLTDSLTERVFYVSEDAPTPVEVCLYPVAEQWYECALDLNSLPSSDKEILIVDGNYEEMKPTEDYFLIGTHICFKTIPLFPVEVAWKE